MQHINFSPTSVPRGSRRQHENVNAADRPIRGIDLRERLDKAQERRWPYVQGFHQDSQHNTGTKQLLSQAERGSCKLTMVCAADLKNSYRDTLKQNGGINHLLEQDLPAGDAWVFERAIHSYHSEAELMPGVCNALQVFTPYLHAPEPSKRAPATHGARGRLPRYHLFLVGKKHVIQQITIGGSRPDAGIAVHLMASWEGCAAVLAQYNITVTKNSGYREPQVNRQGNVNPDWFKGRILNCEVKKDSSLRAVLHKIQALSEASVRVQPSKVTDSATDRCMYVQVAYQMQTSRTEWATLESPDYIVLCHMKASETHRTLYLDGPYRRHNTVHMRPDSELCSRDLDVFTWHDYFEFVAFAWSRAVKAEQDRADEHPDQIWPEGATVHQQGEPESGQLPRALHSRVPSSIDVLVHSRVPSSIDVLVHSTAPSSIDVLANMRECLSKLADVTGVSALRRSSANPSHANVRQNA